MTNQIDEIKFKDELFERIESVEKLSIKVQKSNIAMLSANKQFESCVTDLYEDSISFRAATENLLYLLNILISKNKQPNT